MLEKNLKKLNFSDNEIKVYLTLFKLGKCRAGKIIEQTGLHRNLVYSALEKLGNRNLVTKVLGRKAAEFSANSPDSLLEEIEHKKQLANQAAQEINKMINKEQRDIKIYEGLDGIKKARNQRLDLPSGSEFFVMGAGKLTQTPELEKFWRQFHKKREKKGIKQKILYESTTDPAAMENIKWRNQQPGFESRFLPFTIDSPFWFDFASDRVNLGFAGKNPLTINIKSQDLVQGFKKYFKYFWNQKVITKTGFPAFENAMNEMLDELKAGEEYHVLGTTDNQLEKHKKINKFYNNFHKRRIEKGIKVKMLSYEESYKNIKKRFKTVDPKGLLSQLKSYTTASANPMQICLYRRKALIIIYEKEPTVIYFNKPEVYEGFKNQFDKAWQQKIKAYEGTKQIKNLLWETLNFGDYSVFTEGIKIVQVLGKEFFIKWQQEKKKRGIKSRGIMNAKYKSQPTVTKSITQIKFIPGYIVPSVTLIFKNKIVNINFSKEPKAFLIEDLEIAKSNQSYFDLLWNQETYVLKGLNAIGDLFNEMLEHKEVCLIGARGYFIDLYPKFTDRWEKKAKKIPGFKLKNIVDPSILGHRITKFPFAQTKYTLEKEFSKLSVFWIFGNKVVISNWTEKEPTVVIIENKHIYNLYKQQFDLLWNK